MELGIRLRSLLDGKLNTNTDLTDYKIRNELITEIEAEIDQCEWMELSDGTTYQKSFTPTYFRELQEKEEKEFRQWARDNYEINGLISSLWHPAVQDECKKMNIEQRNNKKNGIS